jgi:hypothetical protein
LAPTSTKYPFGLLPKKSRTIAVSFSGEKMARTRKPFSIAVALALGGAIGRRKPLPE